MTAGKNCTQWPEPVQEKINVVRMKVRSSKPTNPSEIELGAAWFGEYFLCVLKHFG